MGPFGSGHGEIDTLVLGCTHYLFAADQLSVLLGNRVQIIDTGEPVARQARRLLQAGNALAPAGAGQISLLTTGEPHILQAAANRWLALDVPVTQVAV